MIYPVFLKSFSLGNFRIFYSVWLRDSTKLSSLTTEARTVPAAFRQSTFHFNRSTKVDESLNIFCRYNNFAQICFCSSLASPFSLLAKLVSLDEMLSQISRRENQTDLTLGTGYIWFHCQVFHWWGTRRPNLSCSLPIIIKDCAMFHRLAGISYCKLSWALRCAL